MKNIDEKIKKAILKKATGYEVSETVEEYQDTDGGLVLTKKKVTKKHVPPDTQAVKILLELTDERDLKTMTEEELESEKQRLLKILKEFENENK
ncbi:MAG: hypothetical protein ACI4M6_01160 [Christensenellaceae bacterium]